MYGLPNVQEYYESDRYLIYSHKLVENLLCDPYESFMRNPRSTARANAYMSAGAHVHLSSD